MNFSKTTNDKRDYLDNEFSNLSEEQKLVFFRAMMHLAKVDGNFDDRELEYIIETADSYGIEADKIKQICENDTDENIFKDLKKISSRRVALDIIKELCLLSHTDDVLSDEETYFIGKCGQAMGVELEKIEQISNWVIDRIVWLEQAKLIFED